MFKIGGGKKPTSGRKRTVSERHQTKRLKQQTVFRVAEVFRAGAYEVDHTYVARPSAEDAVRTGLRHQNAIILLSGPSKSGKTVLCHRLSEGAPTAHVHVFQAMTGEEFWDALRQAIEAPERSERITKREQRLETERAKRLKGGANAQVMSLEAETSATNRWRVSEASEETTHISTPGRMGVLNYLRSHPHTIIIDDYHWMNPAIAPEVFPPLKQVLGWNSRVILISVSKAAFPNKGDFGDFTGRFIDVSMPPWELDEIKEIGERGFPLLKVQVSQETLHGLASCSYLSPLLMQGLCEQLCFENQVVETLKEPINIHIPGRAHVGALAGRFAAPLTTSFDEILSDKTEKTWVTRDGRKLSLTEILVLGISHKRPFEPFPLAELSRRLEEKILRKPMPKNLSALLVQKMAEIQTKFGGERGDRSPIYYDPSSKSVTIVDAYFKLWVRWVRGPELGGKLFPPDKV